jgi:hypothetical protein
MVERARAMIPVLRERAPRGDRERPLPIETSQRRGGRALQRFAASPVQGRQHISNQYGQLGRAYDIFLFGIENNEYFMV